MNHVLAYDIGTTGVKTCLFDVSDKIRLLASATAQYPLYVLPDGGAEQDAQDWWHGMCVTTRKVLETSSVDPAQIKGISFCSQMQGVVLVDRDGVPVRRPMSYMDQRATEEIRKGIAYGLQIAGANILKLIPSLRITGAVTSSVKDPVWKYKWIESHEKENFSRAYRWLDVKDYLTSRCTGRFTMTEDSAFATLIYDTRPGHRGWSRRMCSMFGIDMELLPEIIKSTDEVGPLSAVAASELGLVEGIPVFGGGGDSSLINVGAGAVKVGDTHVYSGTSGWVITVVPKQMVDVTSMIAAIPGAQSGKFNYFAEMETAGKSLQWVKELVAEDVIGKNYEHLDEVIGGVPAGSNGLLFTPWLHGNRCPFEDPKSTGTFVGLRIETTKAEMVRSVMEGVFFHLRWMLECQDRKVSTSTPVRFVGGGAKSRVGCQMLSDILGRDVETVESPQNVGSVGAAAIVAVGLGLVKSIEDVAQYIPSDHVYRPDMTVHQQYEKYYRCFRRLYSANRRIFRDLG